MVISVQFLEGGPESARLPPRKARELLRSAFDCLPIDNVILGWNLPAPIVEACAAECALRHADLYLWQPLLAGDGVFRPRPEWRTVGTDGLPISDRDPGGREEFTFVCPNRAAVREAVLRRLDAALAGGFYQGVFLDRIRYPMPVGGPGITPACFCGDCARSAESGGVDLASARTQLERLMQTPAGRRTVVRLLLAPLEKAPSRAAGEGLEQWLAFRRRSITAIVKEAAELSRGRGLKVGLDCYSPTLAPIVGQSLAKLSALCDWIKGMTYIRAFGPAAIPYEIIGLVDWIMASQPGEEKRALAFLAEETKWDLPLSRGEIRRGGLPAAILAGEIARGRGACACPFLAGIELVEIPGVCELRPAQIRTDIHALRTAAPAGMVLSWDIRLIAQERLRWMNGLLHGNEA
jgi:hypothetical protein